jgi:hypothetical protein
MKPVDLVLDRLEGVKKRGESYQALCPAHEDRDPSLSVAEGEDGRVLLNCFSGCRTSDVVEALDLEMKDLFLRRNGHGEGGLIPPQEHRQPINRPRWRTTRITSGFPSRSSRS